MGLLGGRGLQAGTDQRVQVACHAPDQTGVDAEAALHSATGGEVCPVMRALVAPAKLQLPGVVGMAGRLGVGAGQGVEHRGETQASLSFSLPHPLALAHSSLTVGAAPTWLPRYTMCISACHSSSWACSTLLEVQVDQKYVPGPLVSVPRRRRRCWLAAAMPPR